MKNFIFLLCTLWAFIGVSAEIKLTDFKDLAGAEKMGWRARSSSRLSVPAPGVLRCQGMDKKRYCGMEIFRVPLPDLARSIKCKLKMNFGRQIYFVLITENGYFDCYFPIQNNVEQTFTVPLDIKKWRFRGKGARPAEFGNIKQLAIMHPRMQKSSEFIEISQLIFPVKDEEKNAEKITVPVHSATIKSHIAEYIFSSDNGSLLAVKDKRSGNLAVQGVENHYFLKSRSGDAESYEKFDEVLSCKTTEKQLHFTCINDKLPDITIEKIYSLENDRLRRKTIFHNHNKQNTAFITPRTRVRFSKDFYDDAFYLGSGYIGPLMKTPGISAPQQERSFLQTTKGMLIYHDGSKGSFAQYRTHLNGKFVFPWWQSAIATYQEKENALFYQPDGWEMALGTIDILPGKTFTVEDTFVFFNGNWHAFLTDIYPNDPVVSKVLKSFKPGPAWLADVKVNLSTASITDYKKLSLLIDEGEVIAMLGNVSTGSWGDYHFDSPKPGFYGGSVSAEDIKAISKEIKRISPAFRLGIYNWVNSAMGDSDVVKMHPEFFMFKNRNMQEKSLFPGNYKINYPVMINRPDAAAFMLDNFRSLIDTFDFDYIYLDETKTVSLIDWQRNDLMRDDHWADFWMGMHKLGQEKNVLMFGNGRGNPYHELNYIEARNQLAPSFWRKFCGMAMAVATFVNHRPGARVDLLYWNPEMDYITRVLANGFIPTINFLRYQQIPYITANYELGKSSIYDLEYTPDWKYDPKTELESYAICRDLGKEVILSLINRSRQNSVKVEVNTGKLPENLTVWAYRVNKYIDEPFKYGFGEKERKSNYRTSGWREGVITRPELLFAGKNPGKIALKLDNFAKDEFVQIVFSNTSAGSYSVNDLVCNYFLSGTRQLHIGNDGNDVLVESTADKAEVIVFQAPGNYLVNGRKVLAKPICFGGKLYSVLQVAKGKSVIRKVDTTDCESGAFTAEYKNGKLEYSGNGYVCIYDRNNVLLYCGTRPQLPTYHSSGKLLITSLDGKNQSIFNVPCGKPSPAMLVKAPAMNNAKLNINKYPKAVRRNGALITSSVTYTSRWRNDSGMQPLLEPFTATADEESLTATAGTTSRILNFTGAATAGFLLDKVQKVEIALSHTFHEASGLSGKHTHRYQRKSGEFAGIMLDYEIGGNKFVRKALSIGVLNYQHTNPGNHPYGAEKPTRDVYMLGEWCDDRKAKNFTLDLQKLAPENWTGKVYISAATGFVAPDRRITIQLVRFNAAVQAPEVEPVSLAAFVKAAKNPRKESAACLQEKVDFARVISKPLPQKFYKLGLAGYSDAIKIAALASDREYIYAAVEVSEAKNLNQVEFWLIGSNKKIWQFIAYSDGSSMTTCNMQPATDKRLKIKVTDQAGFFFAIPRDLLGNNDSYRFNLACYRHGSSTVKAAYATYSALVKSFYEPANFAFFEVK
ncbi:MAG: hypothetical protein E7052_00545 [Lentisphaerae bacterium]|nr:hypothetical protein [Lentisphaerota bacterium]